MQEINLAGLGVRLTLSARAKNMHDASSRP
jgi:hypothetical protein